MVMQEAQVAQSGDALNRLLSRLAGPKGRTIWDGRRFHTPAGPARILAFGDSDSGWDSGLSATREEATGAQHLIDLASRANALSALDRLDKAPELVMEIGCLSGHMLRALVARAESAEVIGADYLLPGLTALGETMPGVPLMQFDLKECPLPDASVDVIVALNVLEHIDDDARAMNEIARILRPGGIVVIEVPAGPGLFDAYDAFWKHYRRYRISDLIRLCRGAGLRVEHKTHIGSLVYPAFWLAKRRNQLRTLFGWKMDERHVVQQNKKTRESAPMKAVMALETFLRRYIDLPVGVRCAVIGRKDGVAA